MKSKGGKPVKKGSPVTGTPGQVATTIKRKVSALASQNKKVHIGRTSGKSGLSQRFSNKYKKAGYDSITPLFKTSSAKNAAKVETLAIQHGKAKYPAKVKNAIGGGGGPSARNIKYLKV
jgi:hypothetical protein